MTKLKISKKQIKLALAMRSRALRNRGNNNSQFEDSVEMRWRIGRGYIMFDGFLKPINTGYALSDNIPNIRCYEKTHYKSAVKGYGADKLSEMQIIELCYIDGYIDTGIHIPEHTIEEMIKDFNEA